MDMCFTSAAMAAVAARNDSKSGVDDAGAPAEDVACMEPD